MKRLIAVTTAAVCLVTAGQALQTVHAQNAPAAAPQGAAPTPTPAQNDAIRKASALVTLLAAQQFARVVSQFDATMKAGLSEDKLKATWLALVAQTGAFRKQSGGIIGKQGPLDLVVVRSEFERGLYDIQVAFNPAGEVAGLSMRQVEAAYAPPAYVVPAKFTEREVTVGEGTEWALPGTLSMPVGTTPVAAVVLMHGSGTQDRDETVGPNKLFRDLALGLASRGIAVLRYEKRSRQYPARVAAIKGLTVKDEALDDVAAATALLRRTPNVDAARIFLVGHSLGGMLIPRAAASDPRVAGFVVMAGPTRSLDQAIIDQMKYMAQADGTISPEEKTQLETGEKLVATIRSLTKEDAATKTALIGGAPASYWFDLKGYNPAVAAKSIRRPVLILQGERDYQVTMADDFATWKSTLAGAANVTFKSYPTLNHLFMAGTGKSMPQEYAVAGHVPEDVIRDIATWIASAPRAR